jgi:hypothetical protein
MDMGRTAKGLCERMRRKASSVTFVSCRMRRQIVAGCREVSKSGSPSLAQQGQPPFPALTAGENSGSPPTEAAQGA